MKKLLAEKCPSVAHGLSRLQCDDDAWNVTGPHLCAHHEACFDVEP